MRCVFSEKKKWRAGLPKTLLTRTCVTHGRPRARRRGGGGGVQCYVTRGVSGGTELINARSMVENDVEVACLPTLLFNDNWQKNGGKGGGEKGGCTGGEERAVPCARPTGFMIHADWGDRLNSSTNMWYLRHDEKKDGEKIKTR